VPLATKRRRRRLAHLLARRNPTAPVAQFAFPAFYRTTRTSAARSRCLRPTVIGAACTRFAVNSPLRWCRDPPQQRRNPPPLGLMPAFTAAN